MEKKVKMYKTLRVLLFLMVSVLYAIIGIGLTYAIKNVGLILITLYTSGIATVRLMHLADYIFEKEIDAYKGCLSV